MEKKTKNADMEFPIELKKRASFSQHCAALHASHLNIETIRTDSSPPVHRLRAARVKIPPVLPLLKIFHGSLRPQVKAYVSRAHRPPCLVRPRPPLQPHLSPPFLPTPTRDAGLQLGGPGSRLFPCTFLYPQSLSPFTPLRGTIFLFQDPTQGTLLQEPFQDPHPKSEAQPGRGWHHRPILHPLPLSESHTHAKWLRCSFR